MKAEYVNPFLQASHSVLEMVLGARPIQGALAAQTSTKSTQQCCVVCGVTGQVEGQVIYGMSLSTADNIASAMLGQQIETFDALAASALGELGNMISGNALQFLSEAGWICDITPPTVMRGPDVRVTTISVPAIVVPLTMDHGDLFLTVGVQGRK
jgi:chemotaxis protein CheX